MAARNQITAVIPTARKRQLRRAALALNISEADYVRQVLFAALDRGDKSDGDDNDWAATFGGSHPPEKETRLTDEPRFHKMTEADFKALGVIERARAKIRKAKSLQ